MKIAELEAKLRAQLPVHTVSELQGFPCKSFSDFLEADRTGHIRVGTQFDPNTLSLFGTPAEKFMHHALAMSVVIVLIALIVIAFVFWNFWLLFGIPLAVFGFLLSSPGFMNGIGSPVLIGVAFLFVYSLVKGHSTGALLSGAYAITNFLTCVSREYANTAVRRVIKESEVILVWLVLREVVVVRPTNK
jgi:hypothetical protein